MTGPTLSSLFVTIWELYGLAFSDYLPEVYYKKQAIEPDAEKESGR